MRGITLKRPWSYAVAYGGKSIENRFPSSPCAHIRAVLGERVAVHAGMGWDPLARVDLNPPAPWLEPPGTIIATARVVGCADDREGLLLLCDPNEIDAWYAGDGMVGIVLRDVVPLAKPVPCRGALGWWLVPPGVEAAIERQLREMARCQTDA
jgi:hypothetical protein